MSSLPHVFNLVRPPLLNPVLSFAGQQTPQLTPIRYMGCDGALYAFSLFLPTIIQTLGYKNTRAQLLSVPPYAVAAVVTIFVGFIADRTQKRGMWPDRYDFSSTNQLTGYCNIVMSFFGIIGFAMLLGSGNAHIQYAGTFLGAMGIYPCIPNTISWCVQLTFHRSPKSPPTDSNRTANNVEGVYKRGISMGFVIGWGNLNGIVAGKSTPSTWVLLGAHGAHPACCLTHLHCRIARFANPFYSKSVMLYVQRIKTLALGPMHRP